MPGNEVDGQGKHWVNSILPAPESFYDKDASLKLVASPRTIALYSLLLYGLSGGAFAALLAFYSHPSQFLRETVIQTTFMSRSGFECAPLQNDPYYGVDYDYNECLAHILDPNTETVVYSTTNGCDGYYFSPFSNNIGIQKDPNQDITDNSVYYNVDAGADVHVISDANCPVGLFIGEIGGVSVPQSQAIMAFQQILSFYGGKEGLCGFTKTNAPFQCIQTRPMEVSQRISVSYAGAILVFSSLSVIFSWFLQYRKTRIEKLRKLAASAVIVSTTKNQL